MDGRWTVAQAGGVAMHKRGRQTRPLIRSYGLAPGDGVVELIAGANASVFRSGVFAVFRPGLNHLVPELSPDGLGSPNRLVRETRLCG